MFNSDLSQWEAVLINAVWFALTVLVLLSMLTKKTRAWFHVNKGLLHWLR